MRRRIKVFYVLVMAFVIVAGGLMALNRLDRDIVVLENTSRETRLRQLDLEAEKSDMQKELAIKDTDTYIRNTARSLYGYLMPGEILFKVSNPEALYGEGEMPRLEITEVEAPEEENTEEITTEEETDMEETAG